MHKSAIADLARSGITQQDAERAGFFSTDDASTVNADFRRARAIVIPYFTPAGELTTFNTAKGAVPFCRIRYLDEERAPSFKMKAGPKYMQPKASGMHVYFPTVLDWSTIIEDTDEPIVVTEGEKKALAGALAGFPVIGLGGVHNFMTRDGTFLPDLEQINWQKRDVYILFDSDAATNPSIQAAEARLVDEIQRKRNGRCFLVRMPAGEDGAKVGMDDFLVEHGAAALMQLLQNAPSLGALDAKVIALNKSVAWIERENMIFDLETREFIPKDSFTVGSRFSTITHIGMGGKQRTEPKLISVAKTWLTHPHAQRFSEVLFRPGEGALVQGETGGQALNLWTGWDAGEGDVRPFIELTNHIFKNVPEKDRDFAVKLLAYKAQNPGAKVPIAIVLIGDQGSGKSLWSECIHDAFEPYSAVVSPQSLASEFHGWLETSLIGVVQEIKGEDLRRGSEQLKSLISDLRRPMNEKFRKVRQINSYTFYILTSNKREVGAFSADDRRMFVVSCPPKSEKMPKAFYDKVGRWRDAGGARDILGYLLHYDLKGWTPPDEPPLSAEKYYAYMESLTPVQKLADDMRTADEHTIKMWIDKAHAWATAAEQSNNATVAAHARQTYDALKYMPIRPFYSPEELTLIFPHLLEAMQGVRFRRNTSAGQISLELRDAGIPYLQSADDPRGFRWQGLVRQYLVVCNFDEWRMPLRQSEFERIMKHAPQHFELGKKK